jgi:hypothetical protein
MLKDDVSNGVNKLSNSIDEIKQSRLSIITDAIRVIAPYNREIAEDLYTNICHYQFDQIPDLCNILMAAKALGKKRQDMQEQITQLESKRICDNWSSEIWLNSLVLRTLGVYGISYPEYQNMLLKHRHSNGSWFDKIWVTSYSLMALYYCNASPQEIKYTVDFLKNHLNETYWKEFNDPKVSPIFTTSLALESLLLIGEGYEEEDIRKSITWCTKIISETNNLKNIILAMIPLAYIESGGASKKTSFRNPHPIIIRTTNVSIDKQIEGDYIQGDNIEGDKVERKLGDGSIDMKDAVVYRSEIKSNETHKPFKKCPFCGEPLSFTKTPKYCPFCGETL